MSEPRRLEFFDALPTLGTAATCAGLAAPFISPRVHGRPFTMILVVTRRCNSRCVMCHLWEDKHSSVLTLDRVRHMFREPLPSIRALVLTGGEPTLRADLPQIWKVARAAMPQLEYGLLATSGLLVERTLRQVRSILQDVEEAPGRLRWIEVQVSLDGIDEMHDRIRNIDGFFQRVESTLDGLSRLEERYPYLHHKLSCVVQPQNLEHVERVKEFAAGRRLPVHFSPVVFSQSYYGNQDEGETLGFVAGSEEGRGAQASFQRLAEQEKSALRHYYDDVAEMLGGAKRRRTCLMGYFGCVVEHDGEVYPCFTWQDQSFGNLLHESFDAIWFGPRAQAARAELRRSACPDCTSMCYPHAVGLSEIVQEKVRETWTRATRRFGPRNP